MADDQLISRAVHQSLPENYIRPETQRPRLHEVVRDANIPVVDLDNPDCATIVSQIDEASRTYGFFQVRNHGVPMEQMREILDVAHKFLKLPAEEKAKLYSDDQAKKIRISKSYNVRKETVRNWRDYLRLHLNPLEQYVPDPDWPVNPPSSRERVSRSYGREVREVVSGFRLCGASSASLDQEYIKKVLEQQEQHMASPPAQPHAPATASVTFDIETARLETASDAGGGGHGDGTTTAGQDAEAKRVAKMVQTVCLFAASALLMLFVNLSTSKAGAGTVLYIVDMVFICLGLLASLGLSMFSIVAKPGTDDPAVVRVQKCAMVMAVAFVLVSFTLRMCMMLPPALL